MALTIATKLLFGIGALVVAYLPMLYLSPVDQPNRASVRRSINAWVTLITLSLATAEFGMKTATQWLLPLLLALTPALAAGLAGRRPFLWIVAASLYAASALALRGLCFGLEGGGALPFPGVVFFLTIIVANLLGTIATLPVMVAWEMQRRGATKKQACVAGQGNQNTNKGPALTATTVPSSMPHAVIRLGTKE